MPRIPSYPLIGQISNNDLMIIDDVSQQYATKSVELQSLKGYFNTGQATTTYVDDKVVSGAAFNTTTGVLTLTRTDGVAVAQGLDGRYALTSAVFSGNYNDLTNKPTIPTDNSQLGNGAGYTTNLGIVQSLTTNDSSGAATLTNGILNIPQYSEGVSNVQSNWTEDDPQSDAFILNKPTTITQTQAEAITANSNKTSFPGFGTEAGTALEGNTVIPAAYTDSDVDAHLNKTAQTQDNYVLSLSGNDYTWVAQSGGGGGIGGSGTDTQMAIFDSASTITSTQAVAVNSSSQIIMDVLRSSNSYADDTAALAGGVPYGGLYRTDSTVKINLLGNSPGPSPSEVEIGSLIWTDANSTILASSGGTIPILTTVQEARDARNNSTPGAIYWDYDPANAARGLFYNKWAAAAITPPTGFRLPTRNDWDNLRTELIALDSLSNITAIGGGTNAFWNNGIKSNPDYNLSGFESLGVGYATFVSDSLIFFDGDEMWWELEGTSIATSTGMWASDGTTVIYDRTFQLYSPHVCIRFCKDV